MAPAASSYPARHKRRATRGSARRSGLTCGNVFVAEFRRWRRRAWSAGREDVALERRGECVFGRFLNAGEILLGNASLVRSCAGGARVRRLRGRPDVGRYRVTSLCSFATGRRGGIRSLGLSGWHRDVGHDGRHRRDTCLQEWHRRHGRPRTVGPRGRHRNVGRDARRWEVGRFGVASVHPPGPRGGTQSLRSPFVRIPKIARLSIVWRNEPKDLIFINGAAQRGRPNGFAKHLRPPSENRGLAIHFLAERSQKHHFYQWNSPEGSPVGFAKRSQSSNRVFETFAARRRQTAPPLFRQRGKLIYTDFPYRVINLKALEMRADHQPRPIEVRK